MFARIAIITETTCYLLSHNKLPQYKEGKCKDDSYREGIWPNCSAFIIHRPQNIWDALAGTICLQMEENHATTIYST